MKKRCGLFINKQYPWLHASPDYLCSCDCCEEGCGEVKCPYCIENCDFESYVLKPSSCLEKDSTGSFIVKKKQQIFTVEKQYCDFVVCAFGHDGMAAFVHQRLPPDTDHWKTAVFYLKRLADGIPGDMMSNQWKASQPQFAIAEQLQWKTL